MSSTQVRAEIVLSVRDEASAALTKVGAASKAVSGDLQKGLTQGVQNLTGFNVATLGTVGALGAMGAGLKYAIDQAAEAERIMAITTAVVKSTGGAAGLTADQIGMMAARLGQLNRIDDETIQSAQNVLLTFKKIKGEAFEQASQAAIDLSVVMGTDLRGSMMMVGKALEDPIRGITALRRAGVSFTKEQQEVIRTLVETGRAAEAQQMILAELNSQVGGAAVEAADTLDGRLKNVKNQFSNLAEALGAALIPALSATVDAFVWVEQKFAGLNLAWQHRLGIIDDLEYKERQAALATGDLAAVFTEQTGAITAATAITEDYAFRLGVTTHKTVDFNSALSDVAHGYANMGAAANMVEDDMRQVRVEMQSSAEAAGLLAAGLSFDVANAFDDYKSVMSETQPEIDKLTGEIMRMNAAQGKSFTVVTEAKYSIEQYEYAQIKAATAAQKLAEFTGESREEYLQLKIAADEAAENVGKVGSEMGISQQFTADYTKQLAESNGKLDELNAKQAEAEAQLRKTTAEFILQNIVLAQTPEAQLEIARSLGLIDEKSYNLAKRVQELTKEWDLNKNGVIELGRESEGLSTALAHVENSTVTLAKAEADGTVTADDFAEHINVYTVPALQSAHDRAMEAADAIGSIPNREITVNTHFNAYYQDTYLADLHAANGGGQAAGGPTSLFGSGPRWVGEQGPEIWVPPQAGGFILNRQDALAAVSGAGGGGGSGPLVGTLIVNAAPGMDEQALAVKISRELGKMTRRAIGNGAGYLGA
jgi:hypothetical protein